MNERARAWLRRHAMFLAAALLHVALLWLILPYLANQTEPLPSDPLDVSIVRPVPRPPPKPIVRPKPAIRPAEKNSTEGRPRFQPAPRLAHITPPEIHLPLPPPVPAKASMTMPPAAAAPAAGAPGNGSGSGSAGNGNGSQEGNDYLIRLRAYIDAHRNGERHREPHDADVVLVLDPNGVLTDIRVVSSSGDPAVDYEIMLQLRQMSPFPKPPPILFSPSKQLLPVADKWIFPRP
jgi:periplasmic protein TonB